MSETKRIKTALVSVYHKEGLDEIITKLHEEGVEFLSTGGTRQFIESLGYPCKAVEDLTTYPSILGGRVKNFASEDIRRYSLPPRIGTRHATDREIRDSRNRPRYR